MYIQLVQDRFSKLLNALVLTEDHLIVRRINLVTSMDENRYFVKQLILLFP